MAKRTWRIISAIGLTSMLALVAIAALQGGCTATIETTSGTSVPMKCHWAFVAVIFTGGLGAISALLALLSSTKEGRRSSSFISLLGAVASVVLTSPFGIGLCGNAEMPCHQTAALVWIFAGIAILIALAQISRADPEAADLPKLKL